MEPRSRTRTSSSTQTAGPPAPGPARRVPPWARGGRGRAGAGGPPGRGRRPLSLIGGGATSLDGAAAGAGANLRSTEVQPVCILTTVVDEFRRPGLRRHARAVVSLAVLLILPACGTTHHSPPVASPPAVV